MSEAPKPKGYRAVGGKNGKRYMHNGKFESASTMPPHVLKLLETQEFVPDNEPTPVDKTCIFCGKPDNKFFRFINGQTVYVCDEDYYANNVGKTAQRMREKAEDEKVSQTSVS